MYCEKLTTESILVVTIKIQKLIWEKIHWVEIIDTNKTNNGKNCI